MSSIWDEVASGKPRKLTAEEKRARQIVRELQASERLAHSAKRLPVERESIPREEYMEKWREENREHIRARAKEWREENREHVREYMRKWREENRERRNAAERERRAKVRAAKLEAKRAAVRTYKKQWRRANLERELARGRADQSKFRERNPESVRASQRKWNAANKEYKRLADADRYKEKRKAARRARYAAQKAASPSPSL